MNPEMQVLALSATIKNADEVAEWLKAELVTTEWRPTKLNEGVAHGNTVIFRDGAMKRFGSMIDSRMYSSALVAVPV